MLFGFGFALQLERANARGQSGLKIFRRRVSVLLGFGLIHAYLLWWGDILLIYAMLAFVLILVRNFSDRSLHWTGLLVALALPPLAPGLGSPIGACFRSCSGGSCSVAG